MATTEVNVRPTMRLEVVEQNADFVECVIKVGVPDSERKVAGNILLSRDVWQAMVDAHGMGSKVPSNLESADLWLTLPVEVKL